MIYISMAVRRKKDQLKTPNGKERCSSQDKEIKPCKILLLRTYYIHIQSILLGGLITQLSKFVSIVVVVVAVAAVR